MVRRINATQRDCMQVFNAKLVKTLQCRSLYHIPLNIYWNQNLNYRYNDSTNGIEARWHKPDNWHFYTNSHFTPQVYRVVILQVCFLHLFILSTDCVILEHFIHLMNTDILHVGIVDKSMTGDIKITSRSKTYNHGPLCGNNTRINLIF